MTTKVVEVSGLSRRFGQHVALDEVSFEASEGRIYGLVGANGAGKTTLIKHLLGLLRVKSGSVRIFGLDPVRNPVAVLRRIGYLSEERELPGWMRIDELMRYTEAYHRVGTWTTLRNCLPRSPWTARRRFRSSLEACAHKRASWWRWHIVLNC